MDENESTGAALADPDSETRGSAGIPQEGLPRVVDSYEYVANARPYLDHQDWGLLKPMLKAAFVRARSISYPIYSRHGEDFLMMLDCLLADGRVIVSPAPTYLYTHRGSGWSRTTVDYRAVATQSAALTRDPRIAHDHEMVRLLNSRISAIKRLSGEYKGRTLLENRAFSDLLLQSFTDFYVAQATTRFALRRLRRLWSNSILKFALWICGLSLCKSLAPALDESTMTKDAIKPRKFKVIQSPMSSSSQES